MEMYEDAAAAEMDRIEIKVANDAVISYNMTKENGTPTDIYVQAMMVSAAFLQAHDKENYAKWKKIELEAAAKAGM